MKLLVFAHRGEAQSFLKNLKFTAHPDAQDLYHNEEYALLICQEGIHQSLFTLTQALGLLTNINHIINLGIAGSLSPKYKVGEYFQIKTVYAEQEFKSFKLHPLNIEKKEDCLTANSRITNLDYAKKLLPIAPLVDRELWALGYVSKQKNIPLSCVKLISDQILEASNCSLIKEQAQDFSDQLFDIFTEFINIDEQDLVKFDFEIFNEKKFYFTLSQKREVSKILQSLISKYDSSEELLLKRIKIHEIKNQDLLPKQRTKQLVSRLDQLLYPIKYQIRTHLLNLSKPFMDQGFQLKFDETLEDQTFIVNAQIKDETDILKLKNSLTNFSYEAFENLRNGKIPLSDSIL